MAQTLTRDFEARLKKAGQRANISSEEVLKRAMRLYELALENNATRVDLVKDEETVVKVTL